MGTMVLQPVVSHITEALTLYSREQADPKPEKIRPRTITQKPGVKVWMAPPTAKTTAPLKSVPRLPMISPTCPAAIDVTAQKEVNRNIAVSQNSALLGFACERTEGSDLEDGDHSSNLDWPRFVEILPEVWACDHTGHNAGVDTPGQAGV